MQWDSTKDCVTSSSCSSASLAFINLLFSVEIESVDIWGRPVHEMSDVLVERRKAFLDQATISMEITAFQILNKLGTPLRYPTSGE